MNHVLVDFNYTIYFNENGGDDDGFDKEMEESIKTTTAKIK